MRRGANYSTQVRQITDIRLRPLRPPVFAASPRFAVDRRTLTE
jgi:hypothetical protein